jgi:hypothetical protein
MSGVAVQSSVQACSIGHTNTEAVVPCSVAGLSRRRCLPSPMDDGGGMGLAAPTRSQVEKRLSIPSRIPAINVAVDAFVGLSVHNYSTAYADVDE